MRKLVTPAAPTASIPDPDRGGFLPAAGRVVTWTPYWAGMLAREEITVAAAPEVEAAPPSEAPETEAPPVPEPEAPSEPEPSPEPPAAPEAAPTA